MALTAMQEAFAVNKAAGVKNKEAAIAAGYSAKTADTIASRLMQQTAIKSAIAKAKRDMRKGVTAKPEVEEDDLDEATAKRNKMPKAKYDDSMEFLRDAMNHKHLPIAARADYAKALLPYQHARIADKGKKETKRDRAAELSAGGGGKTAKPRFATKAPPPLRAITGGKQ